MSNIEVRLRIDKSLKQEAEHVFHDMGMTMSEAIRIFLKQSVNSSGLPFRPHLGIPNKTTLKAFEDIKHNNFEEIELEDFADYLKGVDDED